MQTLAELITCFQLYAVCEPCQRVEQIDVEKIIAREGPDYPITGVRKRLRCRQCGERSNALRIVYVGTNAKASGFRYRR
ncbi:MAG: hypothetical protein AAF993_14685 [Pseudomonadota bacterium]